MQREHASVLRRLGQVPGIDVFAAEKILAAVKTKGSFFQELFRRWVPRMGAKIAVWTIAHKLVRVIWCILHRGDTYVERGALPLNEVGRQRKKKRLLQALRALGYEVALNPVNEGAIA